VLHHNIGGGQNYQGADSGLDPINNYIAQFPNVSVVTLNEVCASQRDEFVADHPGWTVFWWRTTNNPKCAQAATPATTNDEIGELIASPHPMIGFYKYCLMPDANGNRVSDVGCSSLPDAQGLLCAFPQLPGLPAGSIAYKACVTHLGTSSDAARAVQTNWIRSILAPDHAERMVTVSGDFNSQPHLASLNNMYRQKLNGNYTGAGDFVDADATNASKFNTADPTVTCKGATTSPNRPPMCRTGQNTAISNDGVARKIDYVFFQFDRLPFSSYGAQVVAMSAEGGGASNHRVIIAGGNVRWPG
jgi:hypothetical protein